MTQQTEETYYDWNSRSPEVQEDQIAAYDSMRTRCPVAHDEFMGYTLFKNEDVRHALEQIKNLRGADVHTTTILGSVDEGIFRSLGMLVTSDPKFQKKALYQKR